MADVSTGASDGRAPALSLRSLSKTFGGSRSLSDVDLDVMPAEIHALVGQNGAGKSTLIKILSGFYAADSGSAGFLYGDELDLTTASGDRDTRMRFLHQDLGLIGELSAVDNLALRGGFAKRAGMFVDWRAQAETARIMLSRFNLTLDLKAPLSRATPVQRTIVALAAALQDGGEGSGGGVLVLDEPTAVLPPHEVSIFLDIVKTVRDNGTSVIYVSHRLDELFGLADRITVLRGGRKVVTRGMNGLGAESIADLMLGTNVPSATRPAELDLSGRPVAFEARRLTGKELRAADFTIHEGEVVGLAGLVGSGRDELPYIVAGMRAASSGEKRAGGTGEWRSAASPQPEVALLPADRNHESVIEQFDVRENLTLAILSLLQTGPLLSRTREIKTAQNWIERLEVSTKRHSSPIGTLSGGNQQKVMLARCLAQGPRLLLLCEPTAGVDIGTRRAIHHLIAAEASKGLSVLVSSSDVSDLYAMCTRVLVMGEGRIVGQLTGAALTESSILRAMEGKSMLDKEGDPRD